MTLFSNLNSSHVPTIEVPDMANGRVTVTSWFISENGLSSDGVDQIFQRGVEPHVKTALEDTVNIDTTASSKKHHLSHTGD
jgi:hypothetical protein